MQDDIARDRGERESQRTPDGCITVTKEYLSRLQDRVKELEREIKKNS